MRAFPLTIPLDVECRISFGVRAPPPPCLRALVRSWNAPLRHRLRSWAFADVNIRNVCGESCAVQIHESGSIRDALVQQLVDGNAVRTKGCTQGMFETELRIVRSAQMCAFSFISNGS